MSTTSENTSYDHALDLFQELSFTDKLRFNSEIASILKKEGKSGKLGKAAKKEKNADAPKRKASDGVRAWNAFMKHCQETYPDRFEGIKQPDRLKEAKKMKDEDSAAYDAFIEKFKKSIADSDSEAEPIPEPIPEPPKKEELTKKEKQEKLKAASAEKKEEKKPATVKKTVKKAAAKKEEKKDEPKKITVDGDEYWLDPSNNGLYEVAEDDTYGSWIGYYQPENKEEPIRVTEFPEDE